MKTQLKIDFVSDVMCPWCAIGLHSLLKALEDFDGTLDLKLRFLPFELAPDMAEEGEPTRQHLMRKYGISYDQVVENQTRMTAMAADLGFTFNFHDDSRKWNTFLTHRVLYAMGEQSLEDQLALKKALLKAYFTDNLNPSDPALILKLSADLGIETQGVKQTLETDLYASQVREIEHQWQKMGISSVPTLIINDQYMLSGCQPVEQYKAAIAQITKT